MKLFIAEKPSLAQAIAAGIGVGKKSDGYISLNGGKEIVTWCYGHILLKFKQILRPSRKIPSSTETIAVTAGIFSPFLTSRVASNSFSASTSCGNS